MSEQKRVLAMDVVASPAEPEKTLGKNRRKLSVPFGSLVAKAGSMSRLINVLGILAMGVLLGLGAEALWAHGSHNVPDPVPPGIRKAVPFNIYFPNPAKLPRGYTLETKSFSAGENAVVYKISHGSAQTIVVTDQQKPSNSDMQQFYSAHMPLTTPIHTNNGTAALGALNNETVVSLPTNTNAWLLVTAPLNANLSQLTQVVQAMTLAE